MALGVVAITSDDADPVALVDATGKAITSLNPLPVSGAGGASSLGTSTMPNVSTLQDGGGDGHTANVTVANALKVDGSAVVQPVSGTISLAASGGAFTALPAATANGAALTNGPTGVEITCPPGASVTYTIASAQPASPPTLTRTFANASAATSYAADQVKLAAGETVYVIAFSGAPAPFYRSM